MYLGFFTIMIMEKIMSKRLVDVNGDIINNPEGWLEASTAIENMIDKMDADNIDRSDMSVVLASLLNSAAFHLRFLGKRNDKG